MRLSSLLASTVLAAATVAVLGISSASAAPIAFTWNPAGTANGTLSTASPLSPQFTATNMTVADYATIDLTNPANVIENGLLVVTSFAGGVTHGFVNGTGAGAGGAIGGATPYQLYFTFSSTSSIGPDGSGGLKGQFTSLTYTLWGDQGGACTFSLSGADCSGSGTQLALATGTLSSQGLNSVTINNGGVPAANVNVDITLGADAGSFFVNPSILTGLNFVTGFTNNTDVISHPDATHITINGGGGNVTLTKVPEPVTLSIFGAGLVGAAALRRRKAKKA